MVVTQVAMTTNFVPLPTGRQRPLLQCEKLHCNNLKLNKTNYSIIARETQFISLFIFFKGNCFVMLWPSHAGWVLITLTLYLATPVGFVQPDYCYRHACMSPDQSRVHNLHICMLNIPVSNIGHVCNNKTKICTIISQVSNNWRRVNHRRQPSKQSRLLVFNNKPCSVSSPVFRSKRNSLP